MAVVTASLGSGHGSSCEPRVTTGTRRILARERRLDHAHRAYRIHAVRYAHRKCTTSEAFYGDHHNGPMTDGLLRVGADQRHRDRGGGPRLHRSRRHRARASVPPPHRPGLAEVGVDCRQVQHVVLSHFHYDHVGNSRAVPQRHLLHPGRGDGVLHRAERLAAAPFAAPVEVEDICALVRLNYEGSAGLRGRRARGGARRERPQGGRPHRGHADRHGGAREGARGGGVRRLALLPKLRGAHSLQHPPRSAGNVSRLRSHQRAGVKPGAGHPRPRPVRARAARKVGDGIVEL